MEKEDKERDATWSMPVLPDATLELSGDTAKQFAQSLITPPEPLTALRRAASRHAILLEQKSVATR